MVLVKNLNVSHLEKSYAKEFTTGDLSTKVGTLLSQIATDAKLDPNWIELVYRGEVLDRDSQIDHYLKNANQHSLIFLVETKPVVQQTSQVPSSSDIASLAHNVNRIFKSKTRRSFLEKLLQNNEKFFSVIQSMPELKSDPVSLSYIQSFDLIKLAGDPAKSESFMLKNPNCFRALKLIAGHVIEKAKKTDEDLTKFISKASYSIDDMSEDEDNQQQPSSTSANARPSAPPRQATAGGPTLTQDYLASVLASIRSQPIAPPQQQQAAATSAVQSQQTTQSLPPQTTTAQSSSSAAITRDYFQNVMQQIFNPAPQTNAASSAAAAPTSRREQSAPISDDELAAKLEQMHELGLFDDELNLRALQITEGNVNAAVSLIIEGGDI